MSIKAREPSLFCYLIHSSGKKKWVHAFFKAFIWNWESLPIPLPRYIFTKLFYHKQDETQDQFFLQSIVGLNLEFSFAWCCIDYTWMIAYHPSPSTHHLTSFVCQVTLHHSVPLCFLSCHHIVITAVSLLVHLLLDPQLTFVLLCWDEQWETHFYVYIISYYFTTIFLHHVFWQVDQ